MEQRKMGFWERLTGTVSMKEEEDFKKYSPQDQNKNDKTSGGWVEEDQDEAELAVDVYQTNSEIVV